MEPVIADAQSTSTSPVGVNLMKVLNDKQDRVRKSPYATPPTRIGGKRKYSDLFSIPDFQDDTSKFGSAGKDIELLRAQRMQIRNVKNIPCKDASYLVDQKDPSLSDDDLIVLGENSISEGVPTAENLIILSDSDEEDQRDSHVNQETVMKKPADQHTDTDLLMNESVTDKEKFRITENDDMRAGENEVQKETCVNVMDCAETEPFTVHATDCDELSAINVCSIPDEMQLQKDEDINVTTDSKDLKDSETELERDKGVYVGVEDDTSDDNSVDDLTDKWAELDIALESCKEVDVDQSSDESIEEDCAHLFDFRDDLGDFCRVCGFVKTAIVNIIEYPSKVKKKSSRTYMRESLNNEDRELTGFSLDKLDASKHESNSTELSAHPRHRKQMKPHQVEGFNFLVNNLMGENPGGCILAHAPGSGKTFMMICFTQIFLAKYPQARVLVVLPKGILPTWKKEFETWRVEDIPLYDFYSARAENRSQQLDVLKKWVEQKSILFLGYKQFSTIVCDSGTTKVVAACREILLRVPDVLILDEGHTSRNEETDVFDSLAKIKTLRRVVLSGTLYQNHVKEVFNILNLVRPKFLKLESSSVIANRIMSRAQITSGSSAFFDVVEHTLHKDENLRRRECVIQDLREMTSKVLHYYKGDFLDELPGLLDFTVLLNLSEKQKPEVKKLKKLDNFKRGSVGSLLYVHHQLKQFSEKNPSMGNRFLFDSDEKMDEMLKKIDVKDGVKANFFLKLLRLCESTGEKLLVFSQFLLPLKFFERLAVNVKGWSLNKELFMISGESSSEHREWSMDRFNNSTDARIFFGSIKACGEGISLVGASRILILDVHVNPSVTRQAVGRAFRPGQKKKVYVYRLVAADSPEEEYHLTCFKKELIAKIWFEYDESLVNQDFKIKTVDVNDCGDEFLESALFKDEIKVLYRR